MAATTVGLNDHQLGVFHIDNIPTASRERANKLLQLNHDKFHIVWQAQRNLHNHQTHYLLTYFALGASPEQLQQAYDSNTVYMRQIDDGDPGRHNQVTDENYEKSLGRDDHYWALLKYFETRMGQKGWKETLLEVVFAPNLRSRDLFYRLFEGALHPLIHLGFGVEFEQSAIVAEALAQAAIHPGWSGPFLEKAAENSLGRPVWTVEDNLKDLFLEAQRNPAITGAPCWQGHSFEKNGNFFLHLPPALCELASRYSLSRSITRPELHMRTAELLNVSAWFTCGAQRDGKEFKFDFFLMHAITSSIFFSVFEQQDWLPLVSEIELLESQARMLLVLFVCQGAAKPRMDLIQDYAPRRPELQGWSEITELAKSIPDDGHVLKTIRALNHGYQICSAAELSTPAMHGHFPFPVESWITAAHMVVDTTEDHPTTLAKWMRGPGWAESWEVIPDKK